MLMEEAQIVRDVMYLTLYTRQRRGCELPPVKTGGFLVHCWA